MMITIMDFHNHVHKSQNIKVESYESIPRMGYKILEDYLDSVTSSLVFVLQIHVETLILVQSSKNLTFCLLYNVIQTKKTMEYDQ